MIANLSLSNYYDYRSVREQDKEFYSFNQSIRFLSNLKNLNIIVGGNNTRKSRFFKMLMELEFFPIWRTEVALDSFLRDLELLNEELANFKEIVLVDLKIYNLATDVKEKIQKVIKRVSGNDDYQLQIILIYDTVKWIIDNIPHCRGEAELIEIKKTIDNLIYSLAISNHLVQALYNEDSDIKQKFPLTRLPYSAMRVRMPRESDKYPKDVGISKVLIRIKELLSSFNKEIFFESLNPNIIYLPVLRTSKTLAGISGDVFQDTIKQQMPKLNTKAVIHTGLSLNDKILKSRNGTKEDFFNFLEFERFIGNTFFDGEDINIIAQFGGKEINISLPGERPNVSFNDLGDGVSGIINLLYPIFTAYDDSWVFIEEPENNLHPAFQNIFVKTLAENEFLKKKNLKIFINTHSNHILINSYLSPEDINVMVFSKRDQDTTSITSFNDDKKSTLDLLGVLNTSVLISNCLIWVEGITDRLYVKAFLKAYLDSLKKKDKVIREGLDYCFIEYGGSSIVHYDFNQAGENTVPSDIEAFYSNNRILVLADNDNSEGKSIRFSKFKNKHFVYLDTGLPEIENILPNDILKDFLRELGVADTQIKTIDFNLVSTKKLGEVFNGVKKNERLIKIQAEFGGTLAATYKKKLAEFVYRKVVDGSYKWGSLQQSVYIKNITTKVLNFIKGAK
ncbi:AAA family ATPase [Sphingobacterium sp. UBA5670]|uniref:AAA family ATPase n=1 Tax=Sphingobacterium sp. UBA5670 TaxID=1947502 RepID=UPI0025ED9306|nr:AAA family ATPase [Sphingobacterium sp. UBA5670]